MLLRVYVYSRSANKMVLNYCASYDTWLPEFEQPGGERDALSVYMDCDIAAWHVI